MFSPMAFEGWHRKSGKKVGTSLCGTALELRGEKEPKYGKPEEIPEEYPERIRLFIASMTRGGQPVFWAGQLGRALHRSEWGGFDLTGGVGALEEEGME